VVEPTFDRYDFPTGEPGGTDGKAASRADVWASERIRDWNSARQEAGARNGVTVSSSHSSSSLAAQGSVDWHCRPWRGRQGGEYIY